jgi:hypothetical protein
MEWINPNINQIIDEVKVLVDEGENIEYARGVLEIVTSFIKSEDDMCHADKVIELAKHIGLSNETILKLY